MERDLEWDGAFNVRDLGGLRTADGGTTRRGAVVRADGLDRLTPAGWAALREHGIRTIVDLRNDEEREARSEPPAGIVSVHVPLDDTADTDLWREIWDNELDGTPLYYELFLERKPERLAAAVGAIAQAGPGGVVFHCGGGRDRTGLVALILLALAGVSADDVVADYERSNERLPPLWELLGWEDQRIEIEDILERKGTTARTLLLDLLETFDAETYLRSAGLGDEDLAALRERLLEDTKGPGEPGPLARTEGSPD